mmetsp:Transcript_34886/g.68872  ORF Transcript_34886/g.68872 Transcript_34886/m.68872 type:complete len:289 (+) Transcript_34886:312-1178(+)
MPHPPLVVGPPGRTAGTGGACRGPWETRALPPESPAAVERRTDQCQSRSQPQPRRLLQNLSPKTPRWVARETIRWASCGHLRVGRTRQLRPRKAAFRPVGGLQRQRQERGLQTEGGRLSASRSSGCRPRQAHSDRMQLPCKEMDPLFGFLFVVLQRRKRKTRRMKRRGVLEEGGEDGDLLGLRAPGGRRRPMRDIARAGGGSFPQEILPVAELNEIEQHPAHLPRLLQMSQGQGRGQMAERKVAASTGGGGREMGQGVLSHRKGIGRRRYCWKKKKNKSGQFPFEVRK